MLISAAIIKIAFICNVHTLLGSEYAVPQILSNFLVYHIDSAEYLKKIAIYYEIMVFLAYTSQTHSKSHFGSHPQVARLFSPCESLLC